MKRGFALERDEVFASGTDEKVWTKYCGFLDLSIEEFMVIQKALLMDQLELVSNSEVGRKVLKNQKPKSIEEFCRSVPFTTYEDYEPYLSQKMSEAMPAEPVIWAHTSGRTGSVKWVPYTAGNLARLADDTLAAFVLAGATRKGEVHLREGVKVVLNLPPVPYTTGIMAVVAGQRMPYQAIPPLSQAEKMEFQERIRFSFRMALETGADFAASIAVVLAKVGESFGQLGRSTKFSYSSLHPAAALRLLKAVVGAKLARRPLLPKDIWTLKGLVCGGTDTSIYRDQIAYYWGVQPLDVYVATEACFIAMQSWSKEGMTFIPYSNFYEFIPEKEWLKSRLDRKYQPTSVMLDEVEEGEVYEIVLTNFHGGPFLRYRIGDLVRIVALRDEKTGIKMPQMVFQSRADDVIDIAGFARLDEKTIWRAIQNIGLPYEDWSARKEYIHESPILHIYVELRQDGAVREDVGRLIDQQLTALDKNYSDFRSMTGAEPLVVTLLNRGTFAEYLKGKQAAGFDLAHLKPPHMNAPEAILHELLVQGKNRIEG